MKLVFGVLLFAVGVFAEKELIDSNTEDATNLLTKRLWNQIRKRLKDYGYSDTDLDHLDRELDDEQCTYKFQNGTIIRTHDSIEAGATFINSQIGISREECTTECCSVDNCNIAVFKEKDNDHSCYLFDCGTPNICKFTKHPGYTVIELPDRTTTNKVLEKHEDDLEQLADTPTTTTTTTTTTTDLPTTTSPTQEPEKSQPVSLFGKCKQHKDCAGSWTQCLGGYCVCKDGYHEQEGTCRKDCSKFEFECRNTGQPLAYPQCVAIYNKCDGIALCKDGSDEADCAVKEDGYGTQYGQQLVNQAGSIAAQQPGALAPPVGQDQQSQVNAQAVQPQQLIPQQVANVPYQGAVQSTGQAYGDISQQYGQLNSPLQNINNPVPLQSPGQYQVPVQQPGADSIWSQQQQQQQQAMPNAYNKPKSMLPVQGQMEWNGQSQVPVQQYGPAAVQQNYPQKQNFNIGPPLEQQVQPVVAQTEKSRSHQLPYEARPPPQQPRNKGRLSSAAGREGAPAIGSVTGGTEAQHAKQHMDRISSGQRGNKLSANTTPSVSESGSGVAQEYDSKPQKTGRKNKPGKVMDESGVKADLRTEPPAGIPEEYYKQYSQPYDNSRHGLYNSYSRNRAPYNNGYLNNVNGYMPEGDGYGRGDGYDLSGSPLYAGALPRNRLANGGHGQYLDYDQYFGDGMLNGLDPNVAYDYYPLDTGKKVNHLKTKHTDDRKTKNMDIDNDYTMVTKQELPELHKDIPLDSKEASVHESVDSSSEDSVNSDEPADGKEKPVSNSSEDTQEEQSVTKEKSSASDTSSETTESESVNEKSEHTVNKSNEKDNQQPDKNSKEVQSLGRVVQVVLSQEEGTKLEEADDGGNMFSGFYQSNRGAVVALSLGLCITAMLLIFIGCRLRNVKKRLRRGRPLNSNEADYLINGMYL